MPRTRLAILLTAGFLTALPAPGAVMRVGAGAGCNAATLSAAILSALFNGTESDSIYLTSTQTLTAPISLNLELMGSLEIVGGFANCTNPLPQAGARTTIQTTQSDGFLVLGGTSGTRSFSLTHINWTATDFQGRILALSQRLLATISDSTLDSGYSAGNGGNLSMTGPNVILVLDGASVVNGVSGGNGGGIACSGGGAIGLLSGNVADNNASGNGGGLYLDGCTLNSFAGQTGDPTCPVSPGQQGIYCNFVGAGSGGGIYATNAAAVNLIGNSSRPALLQYNNTPNDGGGIFASGAGTTVDLSDTWVKGNGAYLRGGGVFIGAGATLHVTSESSSCGGRVPCSLFSGNAAGSPVANPGRGGALAVVDGGDATVFQTTFTDNGSDLSGSVAFVDGAGSTMLCEGCLAHHNDTVLNESFFETDHSSLLRVAFSTFDEQTGGQASAIFDVNNSSTVEIFSSILLATHPTWGGQIFEDPSGAGGTRVTDCVVYQETTPSLPPPLDPLSQEAVLDASTLFAKRAVFDYHLKRGSQAQDFCDTYRYTPLRADMDQQSRGFDDTTVANMPFGAWDLGADEWRPLLSDGFETGSCSQWPAKQGGC